MIDDVPCVLVMLDIGTDLFSFSPFLINVCKAGQEEFTAMRDQYFRANQGFMLGYSITQQNSFDCLHSWREHIIRVKSSMHENFDPSDLPLVLVGNKVGYVL